MGLIVGGAAAVLLSIGDGDITALQSFIVVTAVPGCFVLPPCVLAPQSMCAAWPRNSDPNLFSTFIQPTENSFAKETSE